MMDRLIARLAAGLLAGAALAPASALAEAAEPMVTDTASAYEEGGKHYTEHDVPTFNVQDDGTVDWYTFSGFRRYHAECHVCHGPDGMGSTYAPALKDSAMQLDYYEFVDAVVNGRKVEGASGNSVMPAFGTNLNVMCYLDDIYVYLRARGTEAIPRGRPAKKERPSEAFREAEDACMG